MKVIGITGGVGSGKSALLSFVKVNYNCRVILADEAAHQVKEPGGPCYDALVALLSPDILNEDGRIDRNKMAAEILKTVLITSLNELVVLGAIILLRALLSFMIHVEMKNDE